MEKSTKKEEEKLVSSVENVISEMRLIEHFYSGDKDTKIEAFENVF
jgi:hypothetical protein